MITPVLDYFEALFIAALRDDTTDLLKMAVVQKRPFQEDPTRNAPYLIISFDGELGLIPDEDTGPEIGGANYWKLHLVLKAAPKVQTNRELAYKLVDVLTDRILYLLRAAYRDQPLLNNSARMQNYNWLFITKVIPHITGGEREWLPSVEVKFFVRIAEPQPFGNYVGEIP